MSQTQTQKFTVERILEIAEAVQLVGENHHLDGVTAFKLGMLGDACKPASRNYVKERDRLLTEMRKRTKAIQDELKRDETAEKKENAKLLITDVTENAQDRLNELAIQECEIKIPSLKLSEFIAKSDITDVFSAKDGTLETRTVVKAGQSIVPVKFFALMGELIFDDKTKQ